MKIFSLISILFFGLTACGLDGGTHGSIKSYSYPVTKVHLAKAVSNVMQSNSNIRRDWRSGHYNDTENYVTMTIKSGAEELEYTFRYLGDSSTWVNSKSSEIFICYIYDGKGNGGSAGNEKWEQTDVKIQQEMMKTFENDFIKHLDDTLNVEHTDF
jgi:hypothetical protein